MGRRERGFGVSCLRDERGYRWKFELGDLLMIVNYSLFLEEKDRLRRRDVIWLVLGSGVWKDGNDEVVVRNRQGKSSMLRSRGTRTTFRQRSFPRLCRGES